MLLDDELPGLTYLKMLCEQIPGLEVVRAFDNPGVFLNEISKLDFDFCILDIEMPEINGLQVANLLRGKSVIFATAYKEYAAEAYDNNAIDYIGKPIKLERLQQAVQKVAHHLGNNRQTHDRPFVQLNTDKGKTILFLDKISYIKTSETDSRDKIARMSNEEEFVLKNISFRKLSDMLPAMDFCRINKREMIAIRAVQFFSYDEITTNMVLPSGKNIKLILSEIYRNEFLQKIKI